MELHSEDVMVNSTVQQIGDRLERLLSWNVPTGQAFDVLARRAATVEEMVVVEVMRECCEELKSETPSRPAYFAESKTLSA